MVFAWFSEILPLASKRFMLKYVNTGVVFQEIPDETTLAINISGCPCHCPGCHSNYLWENIGTPLTPAVIDGFLQEYGHDITCVSFMGGDGDPAAVDDLAAWMHSEHPKMKVAWYSGRIRLDKAIDRSHFDYIKLGPYIRHLGPLNSKTTNQRLYKKVGDEWTDITARFWKK